MYSSSAIRAGEHQVFLHPASAPRDRWDAAVPLSDLILFNGICLPLLLWILIFGFGVHDDSLSTE